MRVKSLVIFVCLLTSLAFAVERVVTATQGTITKIDKTAKTIVIKTADGTEHVFRWTKNTAVHGVRTTGVAAKDSWRGLKDGSEVVAHSTRRGSEDTAVEIDKVGNNGLKKTEGTIREFNRGGKKLVIRTADGTDRTFKLTGHAAEDAGKDLKTGAAKGEKVAVYSTEEAGKSVAHFFEKL